MDNPYRDRTHILLSIIVFTSIMIRLLPTIVSKQPFSTDSWPILHDIDSLIENTPVSLSNNKLFDGYNNYWPGLIITGSTVSLTTGITPADLLRYLVPFINGLTCIEVYIIVRRLSGVYYGLIASASIALLPSIALFGSGVTKEGFAWFLLLMLFMLLLQKHSLNNFLSITLVSTTLILSHHLITYFTISILILYIVIYGRQGYSHKSLLLNTICMTVALAIGSLIHYFLLAKNSIVYKTLTVNTYYIIYSLIPFTIISIAILKTRSTMLFRKPLKKPYYIIACLAVVAIVILYSFNNILSTIYTSDIVYYAIPPAILLIFLVTSKKNSYRQHCLCKLAIIWILVNTIILLYVIATGLYISIIHRFLNMLLIGLIISMSCIQYNTYGKVLLPLYLVSLLITPCIVYRVVTQDDSVSYYWFYRESEVSSIEYIVSKTSNEDLLLSGDAKTCFLLRYYGSRTTYSPIYQFNKWGMTRYGRFLFIIYSEVYSKGFALNSRVLYIPHIRESLSLYDLVYNNGVVEAYYLYS